MRGNDSLLSARARWLGPVLLFVLVAAALLVSTVASGAPKRADLRVASTSAPKAEAGSNRVRITFVAVNRGARRSPATRASFELRGPAGERAAIGTRVTVRPLDAGVRRRSSSSVTVPRLDPGRWTVVVCLDPGNRVRERSETNNCRAAKPALVVAAPPEPATPLGASAPTATPAATAGPGETATPTPGETATPTATATPSATATASPSPTATATPSATATPTPTPTATPTPPPVPDTVIDTGPSGIVTATAATIAFSSTIPGATFQCRLDAGNWEPCASPLTLTSLGDGPHVLSVRAGDDPTPAVRRWTVDAAAPNTTIVAAPEGELDGGPFTFAFAASDAAATFQCRVDEGDWQGCTSPLRLEAAAPGEHTFAVRALDVLDHADGSPATARWTVAADDGASFTYAPTDPQRGDVIRFTSTGTAAAYEWALFGDGQFIDGTEATAQRPFPKQGSITIELRTTDSTGRKSVSRRQVYVHGSSATAANADAATTYQQNPAHDGFNPADRPAPPLEQAWARELGGEISNPLVIGDRIFVTVTLPTGAGELVALNRRTGVTLWRHGLGDGVWGAAYDDGRIFTIEREGFLRAVDAESGRTLWMTVAGLGISTQLIADDGLVYAIANGIGTKVLAFDARDGEQAWRQDMPTEISGAPMPTLDGDDLFLGYGCKGAFGMAKDTGYAQWWHDGNCQIEGRYVRTSSLHGARLYSGEQPVYVPAPGTVNDTSTGKPVGTFAGDGGLPAFAGDTRMQVRQGTLEAYDERSGSIAWTFAGDGELTGAPVIAAGHAFAGSRSGAVYAVRIADGSLAWEGTAGAPVTIAGLAVAQGTLAVPAGTRLVAFREAGPPQTGGPTPIALEPVDVGPPAADTTVTFQGNAAHTGAAGALTPPLRERWRRPVEGRYSYALSAGGRIFAVREPWSANAVSTLVAIDPADGATLWTYALPPELNWRTAYPAYDDGTVFLLDGNAGVHALDAATGARRWYVSRPGVFSANAPPVADGGDLFLNIGGRVERRRQSDGGLVWSKTVNGSSAASPSVDANRVYVAHVCQANVALDRVTGDYEWATGGNCSGGGGGTAPLAGGQLLARERAVGYAQDTSDGSELDVFPADAPPAIRGNVAVTVASGRLYGWEFPGWRLRWRFDAGGELSSAPFISGRHAYVASKQGRLYAVDLASGEPTWSTDLPGSMEKYEDAPQQRPLPGITAGAGLLLVPAGQLIALEADPREPATTSPAKRLATPEVP